MENLLPSVQLANVELRAFPFKKVYGYQMLMICKKKRVDVNLTLARRPAFNICSLESWTSVKRSINSGKDQLGLELSIHPRESRQYLYFLSYKITLPKKAQRKEKGLKRLSHSLRHHSCQSLMRLFSEQRATCFLNESHSCSMEEIIDVVEEKLRLRPHKFHLLNTWCHRDTLLDILATKYNSEMKKNQRKSLMRRFGNMKALETANITADILVNSYIYYGGTNIVDYHLLGDIAKRHQASKLTYPDMITLLTNGLIMNVTSE